MARLIVVALLALLFVACSDDGSRGRQQPAVAPTITDGPPIETASPATGMGASPPAPRSVAFEEAFGGRQFRRPTELGEYPDGRYFLVDQDGLVTLMTPDGQDAGVFLDFRNRVLRSGSEEGFLSLALDPEFQARPYVYAYYSAGAPRRTVLSRFEVTRGAADPASELVLLQVDQPYSNHNGGAIRFGPDGMLYLGLGDGGSAGDPHRNGQDLGVLLGKIIRIDVRNAAPERPYAVPADNPFLGQSDARGEIWAYGFRNPWRMSFDSSTGALWVADVGESAVEEVDIVERGGNYGWNRLEGDRCFEPRSGCDRAGTVPPVATYTHADGCSISGGPVYRGAAFPRLAGNYLYGDFCSGQIWALPATGGEPALVAGEDSDRRISSFATDSRGEVYLLVHGGPILRIAAVE